MPAMVTLRLRPCTPSAAATETGVSLTPAITGLVAAEALSVFAFGLGAPLSLLADPPTEARLDGVWLQFESCAHRDEKFERSTRTAWLADKEEAPCLGESQSIP